MPPPGVLGVFAEPNEAKAPVPSPNADEAPAPGDLIEAGGAAPNGLVLDVESPKRLPVNGRGESLLDVSLLSMSRVDRVGLSLVLEFCQSKSPRTYRQTYFERRVHRFAWSMRRFAEQSLNTNRG